MPLINDIFLASASAPATQHFDMSLAFLISCHGLIPKPPAHKRETKRRVSKQRDGGVGSTVALNRILFETAEVAAHGDVIIPKSDHRAAHIHDVLRLPRCGGTVRAGVIDTFLADEVPVTIEPDDSVRVCLSQGLQKELPKPPALSLILAVPRPKVLARLLPQIAAIGVRDIVLCNAYKVEKCYFDSNLLRQPQEVRTLLLEGISQSGNDGRLPKVTIERRLKIFLEDRLKNVAPSDSELLIAEPGSTESMFQALHNSSTNPQVVIPHVVLAVGPEGGWMPREVKMFEKDFGFRRVSLGDRILRTDAAVLLLLGLVHEYLRVREGA